MNEEISSRKNCETINYVEERTYKVESTGATISSTSSISLLHRYCSKLPHDEYGVILLVIWSFLPSNCESVFGNSIILWSLKTFHWHNYISFRYFIPRPQFFNYDDADGMVCKIILPANAPIHEIVSEPQQSTDTAKRDACLKACKALHEAGALTDYLLPEQEDISEDSIQDFSDSDSCDGYGHPYTCILQSLFMVLVLLTTYYFSCRWGITKRTPWDACSCCPKRTLDRNGEFLFKLLPYQILP